MGSGAPPRTASSSNAAAGTSRQSGESSEFSMRELENEIVDISAASSGLTSSKVKLLFAKSKGTTFHCVISSLFKYMFILRLVQKTTSPDGSLL